MEKLVAKISLQRNYKIAHDDGRDRRGIDAAFIYDADSFETREKFSHYIVKRNATRELFQVNLKMKGNGMLLV